MTEFDFSSIPIVIEESAQPLQETQGSKFEKKTDLGIYEDSVNDIDHEDKKHFIYQSISTFDEFIPSSAKNSGDLNNYSDVTKVKDQSERVHEENNYLDCTICNLSFSSTYSLNTHIYTVHTYKVKNQIDRVHEEKNQFDCGICELPFSSKQRLNTHIYTVHVKTEILFGKKGCSTAYVCKHCTFESPFESLSEIENHMEKAHGVRMQDKNVTEGTGNSTKIHSL